MTREILLIMDDCGAGDALQLTPHIAAVRSAFPAARISMLCSAGAAEVYGGSAFVDRMIPSRLYRRRPSGFRSRLGKALELGRLALELRRRHDLVIVFWWGSRALALLAAAFGRRRFGYGRGEFDLLGDGLEQNARLLLAAGIAAPTEIAPLLTVEPPAVARVSRTLKAAGWDGRASLVVLHTGSDWACQEWLPERWAELGARFAAEPGTQVVFTGTATDRARIEAIRDAMRAPSISMVGKTTIAQLAALIGMARLLVTVDSAAYAVARSRHTPAVVLAGPTDPVRRSEAVPTAVVQKATEATRIAIGTRKRARFAAGQCHEADCPLAGMPELSVNDVVAAVESLGEAGQAPRLLEQTAYARRV